MTERKRRPKQEVQVYAGELVDAVDDISSSSIHSVEKLAERHVYKATAMNLQIVGESLRAIREHHATWYREHKTEDWEDLVEERHTVSHNFVSMTPQGVVRLIGSGTLERARDQLLDAIVADPPT